MRGSVGPYEGLWETRSVGLKPSTAKHARRALVALVAASGGVVTEQAARDVLNRTIGKSWSCRRHRRDAIRNALEVVEPRRFAHIVAAQRVADLRMPKARTAKRRFKFGCPVEEWPAEKQRLWHLATRRPKTTYGAGGTLGRLSIARIDAIRKGLGLFYAFQSRTGRPDLSPETIDAFLLDRKHLTFATRAADIAAIAAGERAFLDELRKEAALAVPPRFPGKSFSARDPREFRRAAAIPGAEFPLRARPVMVVEFGLEAQARDRANAVEDGRPLSWLFARAATLKAQAEPARDKTESRVDLWELIALGFDLMDKAEGLSYGASAAVTFRTGLFIALLGLRCVRLATILDTRLPAGVSKALPQHGFIDLEHGVFYWPPGRTKQRRRLRTKIPAMLRPKIERWLAADGYRVVLARPDETAFWVNRTSGGPLGGAGARNAFEAAIWHSLKKHITPHLTRDLNAAFMCEEMPEMVAKGLLTELLGHARGSSAITERYKALVRDAAAAARMATAMRAFLKAARAAT